MAKEKTSAKTGKDKTGKTGAGKTDKSGKIPIPLKDKEDVKPPLADTNTDGKSESPIPVKDEKPESKNEGELPLSDGKSESPIPLKEEDAKVTESKIEGGLADQDKSNELGQGHTEEGKSTIGNELPKEDKLEEVAPDDASLNEGAKTTEAPAIENEQPINAAWAINLALHYKEDIAGSNVSPEVIEKEVYGEGGIMETLKSYRPKLPSDKLEEFDQILSAIDGLVKFKKSPPLTEQQPPVGQKAEPAAPVAPKLSAKERLQLEFGKVSKALKEFKETRICHPQHVHDFCKQSSAAGFEFTYDAAENKLKGSFLGEKESCEFVLGT